MTTLKKKRGGPYGPRRRLNREEFDAIRSSFDRDIGVAALAHKFKRGERTIRMVIAGEIPARLQAVEMPDRTKRGSKDALQVAILSVLADQLPEITQRVAAVCRHAMAEDVADAVKEVFNGRQ